MLSYRVVDKTKFVRGKW